MSSNNRNSMFLKSYSDYVNSFKKSITGINYNSQPYLLNGLQQAVIYSVINQSIDELVISNKGKVNFFLLDQLLSMKESFQRRQRIKLFDEQTLEPMYIALKRMLAVKLERDMYDFFIVDFLF